MPDTSELETMREHTLSPSSSWARIFSAVLHSSESTRHSALGTIFPHINLIYVSQDSRANILLRAARRTGTWSKFHLSIPGDLSAFGSTSLGSIGIHCIALASCILHADKPTQCMRRACIYLLFKFGRWCSEKRKIACIRHHLVRSQNNIKVHGAPSKKSSI